MGEARSPAPIDLSVIVPTRGRPRLLSRTLEALAVQTHPRERFETLVVAGGASAGEDDAVRRIERRLSIRLVRAGRPGAAAARNRGAGEAQGDTLLFLDDDVVPGPRLVAAHVAARRKGIDIVGVGPYFPDDPPRPGFFSILVRNWWEDRFAALAASGHRFDARDVLSGNLSIGADRFRRLGGFDESLPAREDWEFGIRLLRDGANIVYLPEAAATHFVRETMNLRGALARAYAEGEADARILGRFPDDAPLFAAEIEAGPFLARLSARTARKWPAAGAAAAEAIASMLPLFERAKMRRTWRHVYGAVRHFHYALGRARGGRRSKDDALPRSSRPAEIAIDLGAGIAAAEKAVDVAKPDAIRVFHRGRELLFVPPVPGAERLRGEHLRPILAGEFGATLAKAMSANEGIRSHTGA